MISIMFHQRKNLIIQIMFTQWIKLKDLRIGTKQTVILRLIRLKF